MAINDAKLTGATSTRIHVTLLGKRLVVVTVQEEGQSSKHGHAAIRTEWRDATESDLSELQTMKKVADERN